MKRRKKKIQQKQNQQEHRPDLPSRRMKNYNIFFLFMFIEKNSILNQVIFQKENIVTKERYLRQKENKFVIRWIGLLFKYFDFGYG